MHVANLLFFFKGGHQGHFAQVTFRWTYPAQQTPKLFLLHQGKVVFEGETAAAVEANTDESSRKLDSDDE